VFPGNQTAITGTRTHVHTTPPHTHTHSHTHQQYEQKIETNVVVVFSTFSAGILIFICTEMPY